MVRKYFLLLIMMQTFMMMPAQEEFSMKKFRKEVRADLKANNFGSAEKRIDDAVKAHPELKDDEYIINTGVIVSDNRAKEESRKIYLASSPDTTKYFSCIYNLYDYANRSKNLNKRKQNALGQRLLMYYTHLSSAGKYFYSKSKYVESQKFIEMYLKMMNSPLLTGNSSYTQPGDSMVMTELGEFAAFKNKDFTSSVSYFGKLKDRNEGAYEVGVKSFIALADTAQFLSTLKEACDRYPTYQFFYKTLLQHYSHKLDYQNTLDFVNVCIQHMPDSVRLWNIKGTAQSNLDMKDSALVSFKYVLNVDPDNARAYASIGDLYLDKAHEIFEANTSKPGSEKYRQETRRIKLMYMTAKSNYEKAQKLEPDNTRLWLEGLRECYYKLNNGKELRKLEKLK